MTGIKSLLKMFHFQEVYPHSVKGNIQKPDFVSLEFTFLDYIRFLITTSNFFLSES